MNLPISPGMTNCPLKTDRTDLLLDDAAGTLARRGLDAATMAALSQHMETCPACLAFRAGQKMVWNALDFWEPGPVSQDFNRRLWQRIDAAASAPWYARLADSLRMTSWKPLIPLTAAILVIAGGFLLDHPGANKTHDVTIIEADQVEQTLDDIQLLRQLDVGTTQGGSQTRM
jgi:hypothetical protein